MDGQHESQHVCVCVRGHACVCKWLVSVCNSDTNTLFTGCTGFSGGRDERWQYSRQFCFSVSPPRQLVLVGRKIKDGRLASSGGNKSKLLVTVLLPAQKHRKTASFLHPKHFYVTSEEDAKLLLLLYPRSLKLKKKTHPSLVTVACCSTWQMCGRFFPSVFVFQVSFRVPLLFTV